MNLNYMGLNSIGVPMISFHPLGLLNYFGFQHTI